MEVWRGGGGGCEMLLVGLFCFCEICPFLFSVFLLIDIFYCSVIVFFSDQVLSATLPLTTASRTGTATQSDFNSTIYM